MFKIEYRDSTLSTTTLCEKFDIVNIDKLLNAITFNDRYDEEYILLYKLKFDNVEAHLREIKNHIKNGVLKVNLTLDKSGFGRLYSKGALSYAQLSKSIRHTLAKEYTDFDMNNAHFQIVLCLCNKYKLSQDMFKQIKYYCEHRDDEVGRLVLLYFKIDKSDSKYTY